MENVDITGKVKQWIFIGVAVPLTLAAIIGYGVFKHYHATENIQIADAKVTGTLVAVRTLVDGKVSEILFNDGDEVKVGDVIARLEVNVTEETIAQLEDTVALAKQNYEDLKLGQTVKVPVKRVRVIPAAPTVNNSAAQSNANLASLEERANRMSELFEMGAVSRVQRDAAVAAYENAKANAVYTPPTVTQSSPTYVEEIDYVDQWQPTPAPVLQNAENAIKQAELSLKVAQQQAQETEVIAPVSGTIYYSVELEKEVTAGNSLAKIGDSNELWLAAEVTEDTFNKITLGKPVDYVLAGENLSGTVIEKIAPIKPEEKTEPEPETNATWIPPTEDNEHPEIENFNTDDLQSDNPFNDKYILKFSLPAERDFDCKPNSTTNIKIKLYKS